MTEKEIIVLDFIRKNFVNEFYTGVGSRDRPEEIGMLIQKIAYVLKKFDMKLRTGDAAGCDYDFRTGAELAGASKENGYILALGVKDCTPEAQEVTQSVLAPEHWANCNAHARKLLGRNSQQVLGEQLDSPTSCVIAWTPNGEPVGGTQVAIKVAWQRSIPVYNLFHKKIQRFFIEGLLLEENYLPF